MDPVSSASSTATSSPPVEIEFLVPAVLLAIAVTIGSLIFFISKLKSGPAREGDVSPAGDAARRGTREENEPALEDPAARRLPVARGARNRMVRQARRQEGIDDEGVGVPYDEPGEVDDNGERKKVGVKKARKMEMKAERQAQREQELAEREDRKHRQELLDEQRLKEAQQEEQMLKEEEEEEERKKELQEKQELEEYIAMKENFEVEDEGFEKVLDESESDNLLQEFINYIKLKKVVLLEDLGGQFNMKTQDAIKRVQELQEQGLLTGVIDDRGKFIFISQEELEGVATFMRQRGRVAISELAEASNLLIRINPETDTASKSVVGMI